MDVNLEQWNDSYADAVVEESDEYADIPDGNYDVTVAKVELKNSQKGNPMLSWQLKITGPKMAGRMMFRHNMIMNDNNVKWLKSDLSVCGIILDKLSDLAGRLEDLLDLNIKVTKKTNGDFENVYLNGLIGSNDAGGSVEEDVPF